MSVFDIRATASEAEHKPNNGITRHFAGDQDSATITATASISATIAMKVSASISSPHHMTAARLYLDRRLWLQWRETPALWELKPSRARAPLAARNRPSAPPPNLRKKNDNVPKLRGLTELIQHPVERRMFLVLDLDPVWRSARTIRPALSFDTSLSSARPISADSVERVFWGDDQNGLNGVLQWRRQLKINFCEIFGAARFSTFATVSANCCRSKRAFPQGSGHVGEPPSAPQELNVNWHLIL